MVHSVLVNRSKSSSEKSTGLSKELCRLGDRHESPVKRVSSGSTEDDEEEEAGGAEEVEEEEVEVEMEMEESRWSGAVGPASLSCIRLEPSPVEVDEPNTGGD